MQKFLLVNLSEQIPAKRVKNLGCEDEIELVRKIERLKLFCEFDDFEQGEIHFA